MSAPERMTTARLVLRGLEAGDQSAVYALLSDIRVVRYMLFPLFSEADASAFVRRFGGVRSKDQPNQIAYGITRRESDPKVIGLCGFVLDDQALTAEIWYLLAPGEWGRGYVTEASRALVEIGFRDLKLHRIWASCLPENPGSSGVLERLGFRREGHHKANLLIHGEWRDSYTYAVLSSEWSDTDEGLVDRL